MTQNDIRTSIERQARSAVAGEYAELLGYNLSQEEARAAIEVADNADNPEREAAEAVAEATVEVSALLGSVDPLDVLRTARKLLQEGLEEGLPSGDGGPPSQQSRGGRLGESLEQEAREWAGDEADTSGPWTNYDWAREDPPKGGGANVEDFEADVEAWADEITPGERGEDG